MVGTVSRTARVSGVTRNLKEAAGKAPTRRTEIAYEAVTSGREGKSLQNPIIIQEGVVVDVAGVWGEGHANYPGRSVNLPGATGVVRRRDGLAEVRRGHTSWINHPTKGRT